MTPDELERIGNWIRDHGKWIGWFGVCAFLFALLTVCYYLPTAEVRARHHGHGKPGVQIASYVALCLIPMPYIGLTLARINRRVARFRLRRQDSLARLTKRHEKMLRDIRKLEREVSDRTEDLPPETLAVSMRDYSDRTSDY